MSPLAYWRLFAQPPEAGEHRLSLFSSLSEGYAARLCPESPSGRPNCPRASPSCPSAPSPLSYWEVFHEQLGPGRGE
ncbi:hypothetical protein JOQ06_009046, partial [Pogonophryne albipinna]